MTNLPSGDNLGGKATTVQEGPSELSDVLVAASAPEGEVLASVNPGEFWDDGNERREVAKIVRPAAKWYLTACAIARDELDMPEWVAYQFAVGFDHVHIYDNDSIVPVANTLRKWIAKGKVSVELISGRKRQCLCYSLYLRKSDSKWVAFIDCDEFILPHQVDDIKLVLQDFETFGGLGVTWKVFGSSGHIIRPHGLVIESYAKTSNGFFDVTPHNRERWPQYKTIAQPEFARSFPNPHFALYRSGRYAVNEQKQKMPCRSHGPASLRSIQINHYFVKSAEDFKAKQQRRGPNSDRARTSKEWNHVERWCNIKTDTRIQRFIPRVKELLYEYS